MTRHHAHRLPPNGTSSFMSGGDTASAHGHVMELSRHNAANRNPKRFHDRPQRHPATLDLGSEHSGFRLHVMNVERIGAATDLVREAPALKDVISCKQIVTADVSGLPDGELVRRRHNVGVLEAGDVLLQEADDLEHLKLRLDLSLRDIVGIRAVDAMNASDVEWDLAPSRHRIHPQAVTRDVEIASSLRLADEARESLNRRPGRIAQIIDVVVTPSPPFGRLPVLRVLS